MGVVVGRRGQPTTPWCSGDPHGGRVGRLRSVRGIRPYDLRVAVAKILLYYAFTPLADPDAVRLWQRALCENARPDRPHHHLQGRHQRAPSAASSAPSSSTCKTTREYKGFHGIDVKWSEGGLDGRRGASTSRGSASRCATRSCPSARPASSRSTPAASWAAARTQARGTPRARRSQEAAATTSCSSTAATRSRPRSDKFKDAVVPDVGHHPRLHQGARLRQVRRPQGQAGGHLLHRRHPLRGALQPHGEPRLQGGLPARRRHRPLRRGFKDQGLWEGSLYVFDDRSTSTSATTPRSSARAPCAATPTKRTVNCTDAACRTQLVVCESCDLPPCEAHSSVA